MWSRVRQRRADVRLARVCADEIAGKQFRKGLIDADSVEDAAAMIQAQITCGVAIVKESGRVSTEYGTGRGPKVACGKSRDSEGEIVWGVCRTKGGTLL